MGLDIESLNSEQKEAVLHTEGPLLVLAGAGSGKTRVLTYRIAHILEDLDVAPWQILAITFTNKAAAEMRERLSALVGIRSRGMWVMTFHAMCVRILRAHAEVLGFSPSFTINDDSDSKSLIKQIMEELNLDPKIVPINTVRSVISQAKNDLLSPQRFEDEASGFTDQKVAKIYQAYQARLKQANCMDFDDLLMYTYLLFEHHPDILALYQERFKYVLVDEYQDTNRAQYLICKHICGKYKNVMVVGDDDQSIYSWRGADLRNILDFEKDYPGTHTIKLEKNYRSCGNILEAANAVIANNQRRKQKRLVTDAEAGEKIQVYLASDERDEGRWIAGEIEKLHDAGVSYTDMALFYRTNAQSRTLEDMLVRAGVPYRIVGGTRFFDRAEIKDVMAYLTLVVNPFNDGAAQRIINKPKRGIGASTVEKIQELTLERNISFLEACGYMAVDESVRAATRKSLVGFLHLVSDIGTYEGDLRQVVEAIVERTGIISALEAERTDEATSRIENIKELYSVVDEYCANHDDMEAPFEAPSLEAGAEEPPSVRTLSANSLADFIEWVTLRTDLEAEDEQESSVTLMTIHASKGLEFDYVFVAGMEEGIFPHMRHTEEPAAIEEERRLAYVAITRARKKLHLLCANSRTIFGKTSSNPQSRFMHEIPSSLKSQSGLGSSGMRGIGWEKRGSRRGIAGSGTEAGRGGVSYSSSGSTRASRDGATYGSGTPHKNIGKKAAAHMSFAVGDLVDHKTFGRGRVTGVDGDKITVRFKQSQQTRTLLKDYAPIVKINQS